MLIGTQQCLVLLPSNPMTSTDCAMWACPHSLGFFPTSQSCPFIPVKQPTLLALSSPPEPSNPARLLLALLGLLPPKLK